MVKNPPAKGGDSRDTGSIPGWEDHVEKEMATLHYFCLRNPMDRRAWQATVHGVANN